MNKFRLLLSIVFITIMTIMWTSLDDQSPSPIQSNLDSTERPEYVAIDLNRIVFDKQGNQIQQLTAKKMTYFKSQNRAEFDAPLLVLQSKPQMSKWRISSVSGILYNDERLMLQHDVDATNLTESDYINSIAAQNIRVNIKDNTLLSDDLVQINGDDVIMTGSGLVANLDDEHIELIRHAQTIYQSNKK